MLTWFHNTKLVTSPALSGLYHFIYFNSIEIFHRWQGSDGYRGHVTHQMFPGIQSELTIPMVAALNITIYSL